MSDTLLPVKTNFDDNLNIAVGSLAKSISSLSPSVFECPAILMALEKRLSSILWKNYYYYYELQLPLLLGVYH